MRAQRWEVKPSEISNEGRRAKQRLHGREGVEAPAKEIHARSPTQITCSSHRKLRRQFESNTERGRHVKARELSSSTPHMSRLRGRRPKKVSAQSRTTQRGQTGDERTTLTVRKIRSAAASAAKRSKQLHALSRLRAMACGCRGLDCNRLSS